MLLVTPVSHMHYYAYGLPLACGLYLRGLAVNPAGISPGRGIWRPVSEPARQGG